MYSWCIAYVSVTLTHTRPGNKKLKATTANEPISEEFEKNDAIKKSTGAGVLYFIYIFYLFIKGECWKTENK